MKYKNSEDKIKLDIKKFLKYLNIRSYKTILAFTEVKNFRFIVNNSVEFFDYLCKIFNLII